LASMKQGAKVTPIGRF